MLDLIQEIESCILNNNLRCALGMALTLPDICAHVEFPNESSSQTKYVKWCEKYLFNQGYLPSHEVDYSKTSNQWIKVRVIEPKMCYKLRCAFLHSGSLELNQRKNDNFPVFYLQITSTKENGFYSGNIECEKGNDLSEINLDIRLLTRVLCNAAKEYYENCPMKEEFKNHHIKIVNIEEEADRISKRERKLAKTLMSKKDITDYNELTESAKNVLLMLQNGQSKDVLKQIEDGDDEVYLAVRELFSGNFLALPTEEN